MKKRYLWHMNGKKGKLSGVVFWSPMEGGFLSFRTVQGDIYKLEGLEKDQVESNKFVELEGEHAPRNQLGIGFGVPIFIVKKVI